MQSENLNIEEVRIKHQYNGQGCKKFIPNSVYTEKELRTLVRLKTVLTD